MNNPELSQWYHHDINPIAISWGDVHIPWYWLVYVAGWFWVAWAFRATAPLMSRPADERTRAGFLLWGWIALLAGSRLAYVIIYNPVHYLSHPDQIVAMWNGGMSFHGGFIALALTGFFLARRDQISMFSLTDPVAISIPWVLALGRLANFANGELAGRIATVPWAVIFPAPFDGAPRHPSQLYEAALEGVFVGLILFSNRRKLLARTGAASLAFTAFYAAGRFLVEFTREPDPQLGLLMGLSMGQWLCVAMLIAAIIGAKNLRQDEKS